MIDGATPLADAVAFGQWNAARRLVEHGAEPNLWQAAALGLLDRVERRLDADPVPSPEEITNAFWCELQWIGHDGLTALDAALRSDAHELADWLRSRGARSSREPA